MEIGSDSLLTEENWKDRVVMLYNLALSYEEIGKVDEEIGTLEEMINIGRRVETKSAWICKAYVKYLILMARKNEVDIIEKLLPDAIEYFQKTKDFSFNAEVLSSLYEMIGTAFLISNFAESGKYYKLSWKLITNQNAD